MKITKKLLEKKEACKKLKLYLESQKERDAITLIKKVMKDKESALIKDKYDKDSLEWANWIIVRPMNKSQCVAYAIYAAKQVLKIYEDKYPDDKRPREAIKAAEAYLKNPTEKNKSAARSAAESAEWSAAWSARSAAWSAECAARSAESAAWSAWSAESAEWSAESAEWSAESAESAARSAESAAWSARSVAYKKMQKKILRYGIKLLQEAT